MTTEMKTVEQIRDSYVEKGITKFDELKALDKRVKLPAEIFAYVFGSLSSLVLGDESNRRRSFVCYAAWYRHGACGYCACIRQLSYLSKNFEKQKEKICKPHYGTVKQFIKQLKK